MHVTVLLSDPDKPLPEDVLKALSLDLGFDNKLMELCSKVENLPCSHMGFEHSVLPSADEGNLVGHTHISSEHNVPQAQSCLNEQNQLGSLPQHCKPCEKEMNTALSEDKDVSPVLLSVGEIHSSETLLPSNSKVVFV